MMEILVALTVLALSFTVIMQLLSGGLRAQRLSEEYRQAVHLGQAKMEEILLAKKLASGRFAGRFSDEFSWEYAISPTDFAVKTRSGLFPFRVDLQVNWRDGSRVRKVAFSTLQLAGKIKERDE